MTKIETPSPQGIAVAISRCLSPVRAADVLAILYPGATGLEVVERTPYIRAVDRGLQSARKQGLAHYHTVHGWTLTKDGVQVAARCA